MFTNAWGHYLNPDSASRLFKSLANKAELGDWHIHELRHSATTFMLTKGVPLEVVADILGHSSIRITKDTYGHLTTERLGVGAVAMDSLFGIKANQQVKYSTFKSTSKIVKVDLKVELF